MPILALVSFQAKLLVLHSDLWILSRTATWVSLWNCVKLSIRFGRRAGLVAGVWLEEGRAVDSSLLALLCLPHTVLLTHLHFCFSQLVLSSSTKMLQNMLDVIGSVQEQM